MDFDEFGPNRISTTSFWGISHGSKWFHCSGVIESGINDTCNNYRLSKCVQPYYNENGIWVDLNRKFNSIMQQHGFNWRTIK